MATRQLTEREREILEFLLGVPGLPDRDVLLRQAKASVVDGVCDCGCASISLSVDRSAAPQARPLPRPFVEAFADDLNRLSERHPLLWLGDDGRYDASVPAPDDPSGYVGVMLFAEDGWLSYLEIHSAGDDFALPAVFPPADVFGRPELSSLLR